ncbi:hypothetical protein [Bradyrhizobium mercantei]|uniref:hypothetical protein n=1 Tax=Bradyrhizobium mercantei TaxID=1904807 RepID=UPI001FD9B63F|nr:hypothetical protein [Bradyrhizobium mercantei]
MLAKNCRTSVEMIEKYYAAHLKDVLDASAINVRKQKAPKKEVADIRKGELATLRLAAHSVSGTECIPFAGTPFAPYRCTDAGVAELVDASDLSH